MSTTLSKTELAWQFSPKMSQSGALNRLRRWIDGDPELLSALRSAGYRRNQRLFTTRQLSIIYDYLGDPKSDPISAPKAAPHAA